MDFLSGAYFEVSLSGMLGLLALTGRFTSVSGLGMEFDYETYNEGGSNYPRVFFKNVKSQTLVLEQGVLTSADNTARLMGMINTGMLIPLSGTVTLKDAMGETQRVWSIDGAHLQRYSGPDLNSNSPALAVSRIELFYNGCF